MSADNRKTILVTGASSGIGACVAQLAAGEGCNVVVNYNSSAQGAEAVAAQCTAAGVEAITVQADVADDADCRRLADAAVEKFGRIDALINNAGVTKMVPHGDLDGLTAEDFHWIYSVNTIGAFQMIRACRPALKETGGRIVNVASVAGLIGVGSSLAYACSKAALLAMTKSMARELGPEVCVNAVCPGFVEGEWLRRGLGDEVYEMVKAHYETQARTSQVMTAESVAENIWYFAARSQNVTGEHLLMDGGATLPY